MSLPHLPTTTNSSVFMEPSESPPTARGESSRSMIGSARRANSSFIAPREEPVARKDHAHQQLSALPSELYISMETLQYIDISNNKFTDLPSGLARFRLLQEVNAARNIITLNTLMPLQSVTSLNLCGNNLSVIPDSLAPIPNLRVLKLSENKIVNFPTAVLDLALLEELDLSSNQIVVLPQRIGAMKNLTSLHLRCNRILTLPPEIGQLTRLRALNLRCNDISLLPSEIGNLTSLRYLCLHSNNVNQLPPSVGLLTNLRELDLYSNKMATLAVTLGKLTSLSVIHVKENRLEPGLMDLMSLGHFAAFYHFRNHAGLNAGALAGSQYQLAPPKSRFASLANRAVNISSSSLSSLPEMLLDVDHPTSLDVSQNRLTELTGSILARLSTLTSLNISHNHISALPTELGRLSNLSEFRAAANGFRSATSFANEIGQLRNLTYLDLSMNRIIAFPQQLCEKLTALKHLDLSRNCIGHLPSDVSRLTSLEALLLRSNQLLLLPAEIGTLVSLRHLNLAHNKLKSARAELRLLRLNFLDFSKNFLQSFGAEFEYLHLTQLILSHNVSLAQLPASVCELTQLKRLYVSHTAISQLPPQMTSLGPSLQILDISYNRLTCLAGAVIRELSQLEELNIAGNQLCSLPTNELRKLTKLKSLRLEGNPLPKALLSRNGNVGKIFEYLKENLSESCMPTSSNVLANTSSKDLSAAASSQLPESCCFPESLYSWDVNVVAEFLESIGMPEYKASFKLHGITGQALSQISADSLQQYLGIPLKHAHLIRSLIQPMIQQKEEKSATEMTYLTAQRSSGHNANNGTTGVTPTPSGASVNSISNIAHHPNSSTRVMAAVAYATAGPPGSPTITRQLSFQQLSSVISAGGPPQPLLLSTTTSSNTTTSSSFSASSPSVPGPLVKTSSSRSPRGILASNRPGSSGGVSTASSSSSSSPAPTSPIKAPGYQALLSGPSTPSALGSISPRTCSPAPPAPILVSGGLMYSTMSSSNRMNRRESIDPETAKHITKETSSGRLGHHAHKARIDIPPNLSVLNPSNNEDNNFIIHHTSSSNNNNNANTNSRT